MDMGQHLNSSERYCLGCGASNSSNNTEKDTTYDDQPDCTVPDELHPSVTTTTDGPHRDADRTRIREAFGQL